METVSRFIFVFDSKSKTFGIELGSEKMGYVDSHVLVGLALSFVGGLSTSVGE